MKRGHWIGGAALAAVLALTSAPSIAADPPPLRIAMTLADIPLTDGAPDQGTEGIRFLGYTVYDPLIMWDLSSTDRPAQLVPGLATSWRQDERDPSRWIFELRQGVHFHDGSLFDADALVWNLDRALNEASPQFDRGIRTQTIASLWPIVAYRKLDDSHVELQTKGVDTTMPFLLNRFLIASPAQWEKVGRDWQAFRRNPSGTGPWRLKEFIPRQRAELLRNEAYWNPARVPKTERMILLPMPDASTRTAALLSGSVDWAELPAPDAVPKLKQSGFTVATNAIPHVWPYSFNVLPGSPYADVRVRKALNLAVDRDGMVNLLGGLAIPAAGQVAANDPWFGAPQFKIRYDPDEARRLLKDAGYDEKHPLKFKAAISTSGSGQMYPLVMNEIVQQNLKEVGVDMQVEVFEWQALLNLARGGATSPEGRDLGAINNSWNTMEPYNAFVRFADSQLVPPKGNNWGYINDAELDALVAEARRTSAGPQLDAILARINTRMVDQAYFLWVVHDVWPTALSPRVKGFIHPKSWYVDFSTVTVQ
ncbi:MAG TPA: ABC transporter substrate-binding protein [Alphaproteobacteria bacterium]